MTSSEPSVHRSVLTLSTLNFGDETAVTLATQEFGAGLVNLFKRIRDNKPIGFKDTAPLISYLANKTEEIEPVLLKLLANSLHRPPQKLSTNQSELVGKLLGSGPLAESFKEYRIANGSKRDSEAVANLREMARNKARQLPPSARAIDGPRRFR